MRVTGDEAGGEDANREQGDEEVRQGETPYGRVLTSRAISKEVKQVLRRDYKELNPVALGREIVSTPVSS